jgi:hypothetical protein
VLLVAAASLAGCVPPFSEMQGARTVGPRAFEVTPFYSSVSTADEGEREKAYNQFGLLLALGVGERVDLRARIERQVVTGEPDDALMVVGAGPKVALVPDRAAVFLPVGLAFGDGLESSRTVALHPTLLFTIPFSSRMELNPSTKLLIPLNEEEGGAGALWAANLGLALGPDVRRWAIRPEIGVLRNPGESGYALHYSIGASFGGGPRR